MTRNQRGQNTTEFLVLTTVLLLGVGGLMAFAPDMFSAMTIYVRGFYVILGYPFG